MKKINTDKKTLIKWKVYIDRVRMYIGYIQFMMIGFVFLELFRDTTFGTLIFDNLIIAVPIIFLIFMVLSLIIGRIDTLLGFREEELRNASLSNPVMREILNDVKEIKQEMLKLKNEEK